MTPHLLFLTLSILGNAAPTFVASVIFVLLALGAATLVTLLGKFLLGHSLPGIGKILLYALIGGLPGVFLHFYAIRFLALDHDGEAGTLFPMFLMLASLIFIGMLVCPMLFMVLRNKNQKIRMLEEELKQKSQISGKKP